MQSLPHEEEAIDARLATSLLISSRHNELIHNMLVDIRQGCPTFLNGGPNE